MIQGEFGKYRIEKMIGMGGMSIVYRALDRENQQEIALKLLNLNRAANPLEVRRFQREVEVAQRLRHPNIIDIYEYGEVDGFAYLAMEYMPGGSLAERYADPIYLTLDEAAHTLSVIASALDFAHGEGVLHRDLKLSNVLVAADGRLTLSDFGLALMQDETRITTTGQTFGTPIYMSPEQVNGVRTIDHRADVYSFGVIAYLLATGYFPFFAHNTLMVLNQHLTDKPPLPSKLNPRLPTAIDAVLLKGLSKRPDDRFASAGELSQAFQAAIAPVANTEIVLLTTQPTPIFDPPSEYPHLTTAPVGDDTHPANQWVGEVTPDLGGQDRMSGSADDPPRSPMPASMERRRYRPRWAMGLVGGVAVLVMLIALNGVVPPEVISSLGGEATTVVPTSTLLPTLPSATAVLGAGATGELVLLLGAETTEEPAARATASPTEAATATRTLTRTPRPSATRTEAPTMTRTPSATRTPRPSATRTPTVTRTWTITPTFTTTRRPPSATPTGVNLVVQPTSNPTSGAGSLPQEQPTQISNPVQPAPTSIPIQPTNPPAPTSVPVQPTNPPAPTAVPPTSAPPPTSVPPTNPPPTSAPLIEIEIPLVNTLLPGVGGLLSG